jgi:glucokinase
LLLQKAHAQVAGIGIGCLDTWTPAAWSNAVNLGWREVALRAGVQERIAADAPIWIAKDANASALGELYFGAARGRQDFVYAAVGTGLGGGAVVGGELVIGAGSYAMEIGHMPLDRAGRPCDCGQRGCPEMYASGKGLLAGVKEYMAQYPGSILARDGELTTAAILEAARRGDPLAVRVVEEMSSGWRECS